VKKIFDWHKWNAETYEKPEDIIRAFYSFDVCGKKIAGIRVIGHAAELAQQNADMVQHDAGVPWEVLCRGEFSCSEQTMLPCTLRIHEPLIITFTDGSTFELQPQGTESLKMSVNQIPQDISDGINQNNVDANIIFHDLIGATLCELTVQTFISENLNSSSCVFRRYQFATKVEDHFGFSITQNENWYDVELRDRYQHTYDGYVIPKRPLSLFNEAFTSVRQILIHEGFSVGGYRNFYPINMGVGCSTEAIHIDEQDVCEFLFSFLIKHFDRQPPVSDSKFNLSGDLYTYETVKNIITEIRATANMLSNDFDNPALSEVKEEVNLYALTDERPIGDDSEETEQCREEIIKQDIGVVIDFYERFCWRMELMMEHAPRYNLISIIMV
jgi:hypothetical protein